jgi:hypothetical protein
MRDREAIDSELRLIALARRSVSEQGGQPSNRLVDELLDERLGHRAQASDTEAVDAGETEVVAHTLRGRVRSDDITPHRRKTVLRRVGPMALPLSLLAVAAVLVMMFAVHKPQPSAQPEAIPPSEQPTVIPPSAAPAKPVAPEATTPPLEVVDMTFIAALKHDGVPVPSHEYVMSHGHAVCDFLTQQPNFADAVGFTQRSSIWDANQSADVTAGAIVSYCPQYEAASTNEVPQAYQNALSDLQAIQGKLKGIQGNLHGIEDDLQALPGH